MEADQRLSQERVFATSSVLLLARSVSVRSWERSDVWFCPDDEAVVERLVTNA